MAHGITTAFWSATINNYDEKDLVIVRNGYPDYCREIVHTLEEGKNGTPHIQMWVKLQRQQRMSFLKKLFPGAHFKPITSDEYIQSVKNYAQKQDDTTRSHHVHSFNDPLHTIESVCKKVMVELVERHYEYSYQAIQEIHKHMVLNVDWKLAKIFSSQSYQKMLKDYGREIYGNILHTHTHTHKENKFSQAEGITNASCREDTSCLPSDNSSRSSRRSSCSSAASDDAGGPSVRTDYGSG